MAFLAATSFVFGVIILVFGVVLLIDYGMMSDSDKQSSYNNIIGYILVVISIIFMFIITFLV
ncbi:MAG: hypothetical protein Faunusvirus22_6 [Faunusvirus sp.]|uniref:Uncharacterized protein n=1 Tax=Faunusvirus sp. TaxID=2487766 RepID=A0A3G4ZXD1_9VIRU|nr:MAG: hypothetical protein Faunusvirus22_6 [Faunusvirus sp.]